MILEYTENKIEQGEIPEVVRMLKVGDLVSLIGEEDNIIGKAAGHVIGINFVTSGIRENTQAQESLKEPDYLITLHPLHPSGNLRIENTERFPASMIKKYCIIESKPKSH